MTQNRRIALNIVATYGRSLYALVIGLFCGRWTLMALGEVDYGLMGLVGGLVGFVSFFNSLLASAVGRFYAVSVGEAHKAENAADGIEKCRRWFNTALSIHVVLPIVLIVVGYPLGVWGVEHFLTIPPGRIGACIWVWRFTCLSCFIAMVNVPFQAMYTAKQEIAELTIYSFITTTANACFLYFMITHPGIWLTKFAAWTCGLSILPQMIIGFRAVQKYPECRFRLDYLFDRLRIRELSKYAFARFIAELSGMLSGQARSILVNKYMGPRYNAAMAIGGTVAGHAMTLSGSLAGALWPAIANKAGEGDEESVRRMSFTTCRVSAVLMLFFALPLIAEIREVLRLWLVTPPPFAAEICVAILLGEALQKMTEGYWMAILGLGHGVMLYSRRICLAGFILIGVTWALFALGLGMWSMVSGILVYALTMVIVRLWIGRKLVSFSFRHWLRSVFLPIALLVALTLAGGLVVRIFMEASFMRVVITSIVCEMIFVSLVWNLVLGAIEREYVLSRITSRLSWGRA